MTAGINTLIELYDRRQDDNIIAAAVLKPKRVIFLCPGDLPENVRNGLKAFIRKYSPSAGVLFFSADLDDPAKTADKLEKVLVRSGGGVIDITGGGEAAAFAAGLVCAENHVPVISYDYGEKRFVNIRGAYFLDTADGGITLTVKDAFRISGGTVEGFGRITPESINEWLPDIENVWKVFIRHDRVWQKFTAWIQYAVQQAKSRGDASVITSPRTVVKSGGELRTNLTILRELRSFRLISRLYWDGETVSFRFKSEKLASLMCDAGVWLELYCWAACIKSGRFDDCASGVLIAWTPDGGPQGPRGVTHNELDCVAVRWPDRLFISCKLSLPSAQALNEIRTLTTRFGGTCGKAVLMTMGDASRDHFFSRRAADLNIHIIDRSVLISGDYAPIIGKLAEIADSGC